MIVVFFLFFKFLASRFVFRVSCYFYFHRQLQKRKFATLPHVYICQFIRSNLGNLNLHVRWDTLEAFATSRPRTLICTVIIPSPRTFCNETLGSDIVIFRVEGSFQLAHNLKGLYFNQNTWFYKTCAVSSNFPNNDELIEHHVTVCNPLMVMASPPLLHS